MGQAALLVSANNNLLSNAVSAYAWEHKNGLLSMLAKWFFYSLASSFIEICGTLNCYKCSASTHNSSCFMAPTKQRTITCNSSFCQVWKLHSDVNGQVYMFERDCSSTCVPGCITLSDMENRFVSCSSCCQTDICNTDNHGVNAYVRIPLICSMMAFHWNLISNICFNNNNC